MTLKKIFREWWQLQWYWPMIGYFKWWWGDEEEVGRIWVGTEVMARNEVILRNEVIFRRIWGGYEQEMRGRWGGDEEGRYKALCFKRGSDPWWFLPHFFVDNCVWAELSFLEYVLLDKCLVVALDEVARNTTMLAETVLLPNAIITTTKKFKRGGRVKDKLFK